MEKIDGVDLKAEMAEVRGDLLREQRFAVQKQLRGILQNMRDWNRNIQEAQNTITKLTGKIKAAQDKIDKINAGDWSVLAEEQPPKAAATE